MPTFSPGTEVLISATSNLNIFLVFLFPNSCAHDQWNAHAIPGSAGAGELEANCDGGQRRAGVCKEILSSKFKQMEAILSSTYCNLSPDSIHHHYCGCSRFKIRFFTNTTKNPSALHSYIS